MDQSFGEPHDQYAQPVEGTLEQDGLDHWRAVEAAHKGQLIGYQDCLSNEQGRYRCGEKTTELDALFLQDQTLGPQDQVEANEEEDRRGQRMFHLCDPPVECLTQERRPRRGSRGELAHRLFPWMVRAIVYHASAQRLTKAATANSMFLAYS